jgi:FkbM family methyltransferase
MIAKISKRFYQDIKFFKNKNSRNKQFSQLGQDRWVKGFLERSPRKNRKSFFCDVGAGDPVKFNNTYLLEKYLGWSGILIDPHPLRVQQLKEMRTSVVLECAVSKLKEEKIFLARDPDFSYSSQINPRDIHRLFESTGETRVIEGKQLNTILAEQGAPIDLEYLSIDVEGLEYQVLETLDLNLWKPKLITVEHNYRPDREIIYNHLSTFGYGRVEDIDTKWDDWYFLV